jgi:hypothetical protein
VSWRFQRYRSNVNVMLQQLHAKWRSWRESRRQYKIERALYKAGGGRNPSEDPNLKTGMASKAAGAPLDSFTKSD